MSIKRPLNILEDNQNEFCQYHKNRKFLYTCKDCEGVPACAECVTSEHHGHRLARMPETADQVWRDLIQHYIYKSEKIDLPKVQAEIKVANRKMDENRKHYQEIAGELQKRGDELKEVIDTILLHALEIANQVAEENMQAIKIYKNALMKQQTILEDALQKCKKAHGTQDFTVVFPVEKHVRSGVKLPKVPFLAKTSFQPKELSHVLLQKAFGQVQVLGYKPRKDLFEAVRTTSTSSTKPQAGTENSPGTAKPVYQTESQFRHHSDITHLCCTTDDCAWICNSDNKELLLVGRNGDIQLKTEIDVHLSDMSCSAMTGNLWFCSDYDYSVRELNHPTTPVLRFRTPFMPCAMGISSINNRVVAATFRKICVYSLSGDQLYSTECGDQSLQKVSSPVCVRVCPMSGNIAVLDADEQSHGGLGIPHVTVLTSTLSMLFKYYGSRQTQGLNINNGRGYHITQPGLNINNGRGYHITHPLSAREPHKSSAHDQAHCPMTSRKPKTSSTVKFRPVDICYDAAGHLFIADQSSKSVVMLGSNGQYIKTVYSDTEFPPQTVSFQSAGLLWIAFNYGIVKVIKYTL